VGGRQPKKTRKNKIHENNKKSDCDYIGILDHPCRDIVRIPSGQRTVR
jgi:hypothetical protein